MLTWGSEKESLVRTIGGIIAKVAPCATVRRCGRRSLLPAAPAKRGWNMDLADTALPATGAAPSAPLHSASDAAAGVGDQPQMTGGAGPPASDYIPTLAGSDLRSATLP